MRVASDTTVGKETKTETPRLIAVMGPTASGKTQLAEQIAEDLNAQLVNADAFQVYRGLDIGTAKPENRDKYALLDLKDPWESFGLGEYVQAAQLLLAELFEQNRNVVVVGGSGLYVRALFESYSAMSEPPPDYIRAELTGATLDELVVRLQALDPSAADRIDLKNPARVRRAIERLVWPATSIPTRLPPFRKFKLGLVPPAEITDERIVQRTEEMLRYGWIEEVGTLRNGPARYDDPGLRAIGYRTLWNFLDGKIELEEVKATTIAETRRYAKRQRTWLRSEPALHPLDWRDSLADARNILQMI